jgi:hypothetical protein
MRNKGILTSAVLPKQVLLRFLSRRGRRRLCLADFLGCCGFHREDLMGRVTANYVLKNPTKDKIRV